jgi:sigma-B regulation protein RsbU (phosphoserine phosphatase)
MSQTDNHNNGHWTLTLSNDVQEIPQLNVFIDEICESHDLDMMLTMQMNLAIEEAVVNVMNYGYPEGVKGYVDISVDFDGNCLTFVIKDNGIPFDPTTKGEVDTTLPAEERSIGGLGIHLVRKLMDSINYEYKDGHNVLTLVKKLK